VKIDARRVGDMLVACDVHLRFVVTRFGWIALRPRGDSTKLTITARPATVLYFTSLN
jgi:hypothetical protein